MGNAQKIRMALAYKGMSESELAKALGKTPQAFNQRMKTDKFSTEDLSKIAEIMGASYISQFSFPDGTKIQSSRRFYYGHIKALQYLIKQNKQPSGSSGKKHIYELTKTPRTLSCATLAKHLKEDIASLLDLIENDKPGVAEKVAEASKKIQPLRKEQYYV